MERKANADASPAIFATALCDYTAGMHLAEAIMLALFQRQKTDVGQKISVAMFDSMLAMQMQEVSAWLRSRHDLNWGDRPLPSCEGRGGRMLQSTTGCIWKMLAACCRLHSCRLRSSKRILNRFADPACIAAATKWTLKQARRDAAAERGITRPRETRIVH